MGKYEQYDDDGQPLNPWIEFTIIVITILVSLIGLAGLIKALT